MLLDIKFDKRMKIQIQNFQNEFIQSQDVTFRRDKHVLNSIEEREPFTAAETGPLQSISPRLGSSLPLGPTHVHILTGCHIPAGLDPCSQSWWHF